MKVRQGSVAQLPDMPEIIQQGEVLQKQSILKAQEIVRQQEISTFQQMELGQESALRDPREGSTQIGSEQPARSLMKLMFEQNSLQPGQASVETYIADCKEMAALVQSGKASVENVENLLSSLTRFNDEEVGFLWSEQGAGLRQEMYQALGTMAETYPNAQLKGYLVETEKDMSGFDVQFIKDLITGAAPEPPAGLDGLSRQELETLAKDKIIQRRIQPLSFQVAMQPLYEAQMQGDTAEMSRLAQNILRQFDGQELGLMPWLRTLAGE
jgi:hypothetical protein